MLVPSGLLRADPVLGEARAPIMLVYASPGKVPDLADAVRELPGVEAVAEAGNGLGWLAAWNASGAPAQSAGREGFSVPIEILSVDPADYATFIPAARRPAFELLSEGGALLGRSAAALRGIESTGTLDFGETSVDATGVVDDDLVSSHEAVVSHSTAQKLGIDNRKYVLIARNRSVTSAEIAERLREQFPDVSIGMREPDSSAYFRPGGETLPQVEIKKVAGEFAARPTGGGRLEIDPEWILANTRNESIPLLGRARCHRRVLPRIQAAFEQIREQGLQDLIADDDFGGCFAPRLVGSDPHSGISRHSWGIAFDFNVSNNLYGQPPSMDERLVQVLEEHGFTWGGRWRVPDGMHFEYLEPAGASGN